MTQMFADLLNYDSMLLLIVAQFWGGGSLGIFEYLILVLYFAVIPYNFFQFGYKTSGEHSFLKGFCVFVVMLMVLLSVALNVLLLLIDRAVHLDHFLWCSVFALFGVIVFGLPSFIFGRYKRRWDF
jgi:hypothetical protein